MTEANLCLPEGGGSCIFAPVPSGSEAWLLTSLAKLHPGRIVAVARDDRSMRICQGQLKFFAPQLPCLALPAWNCLPYDRVSPDPQLAGERLQSLKRLHNAPPDQAMIILTTATALCQKLVPRGFLTAHSFQIATGDMVELSSFAERLARLGYSHSASVQIRGEFAVRGGLIDFFPIDGDAPVRLDFFGDEVEQIRLFDPETQLSNARIRQVELLPAREFILDSDSCNRFRRHYRSHFGTESVRDPIYHSVSEQAFYPGLEHWMGFLHARLDRLADYVGDGACWCLFDGSEAAISAHMESVLDYYQVRQEACAEANQTKSQRKGGSDIRMGEVEQYRPAPPEKLYLNDPAMIGFGKRVVRLIADRRRPEGDVIDPGLRRVQDFTAVRHDPARDLMTALIQRLRNAEGKQRLIALPSDAALRRLVDLLGRHDMQVTEIASWQDTRHHRQIAACVMALDQGFVSDHLLVLSEADIFGQRKLVRRRSTKRAAQAAFELTSLIPGEVVVHAEHGIGRFEQLETLTLAGVDHDCMRLCYHGDNRLYVPVENIDQLSRFGGSHDPGHTQPLDRLGASSWQERKAKIKGRLKQIAAGLIRLAAQRKLAQASIINIPQGHYDEFVARFPFEETEGQLRAMDDVIDDLRTGQPMDRLVCGDVGFGKTEIALRAAFLIAMSGRQVAFVAPTTLLARQHYQLFIDRFQGWPVKIAQLSRLVSPPAVRASLDAIKRGECDIAIGTHLLLGKRVAFADLALLIVDEEQRFGVEQKERLKKLGKDCHVMSLSATPIPRTLQMALSGVRDLSLLSSPPIDRLSVRTYVMPYDAMIIADAIRRERYRGGQIFYVAPRIKDLSRLEERLRGLVPDLRILIAHGAMREQELEQVMGNFIAGQADLLLATNIVESGLDVARANTMIVHRSDLFGLAQLHQLRGRIGRTNIRAYCYFTITPDREIATIAKRRLETIQTLDSLGAGFTLASHDMDLRGAGNLLGAEQSGHMREIGAELYMRMLSDAVDAHQSSDSQSAGRSQEEGRPSWSPTLNLGATVMIPPSYVRDVTLRMALYRRLSMLENRDELDAFEQELEDRFGQLPGAVHQLISVIVIRNLCYKAGIERIDAGQRGAVLTFYKNRFANPKGLVEFMQKQGARVRLNSDHRLTVMADWQVLQQRIKGVTKLVDRLSVIASAG
ncbi:MAG: transcription-repair coupling factor [Pseudomonadota bacterium]